MALYEELPGGTIPGVTGGFNFYGGQLGDLIGASNYDDFIYGFGGNDFLKGYGGNDQIWGGAGDDTIFGGAGNDIIWGEAGTDAIDGGSGNDYIHGGTGGSFLTGGAGTDYFVIDATGANSSNITWSTIVDFQANEKVFMHGWQEGVSRLISTTTAGESGYQGATDHYDLNGDGLIDTSITFTGLSYTDVTLLA